MANRNRSIQTSTRGLFPPVLYWSMPPQPRVTASPCPDKPHASQELKSALLAVARCRLLSCTASASPAQPLPAEPPAPETQTSASPSVIGTPSLVRSAPRSARRRRSRWPITGRWRRPPAVTCITTRPDGSGGGFIPTIGGGYLAKAMAFQVFHVPMHPEGVYRQRGDPALHRRPTYWRSTRGWSPRSPFQCAIPIRATMPWLKQVEWRTKSWIGDRLETVARAGSIEGDKIEVLFRIRARSGRRATAARRAHLRGPSARAC